MSLTNATRHFLLCSLTAAAFASAPAPSAAGPLTSNSVYELAGNGDTLWVATRRGLNFVLDTLDSTFEWWGRELDRDPWALSFGDGAALVATDAVQEDDRSVQYFYGYRHREGSDFTLSLSWNHAHYRALDSSYQAVFACYGSANAQGAHWLACVDGGLVRHDGNHAAAFVPGVDGETFAVDGFPQASLDSIFGEPEARPVAVAAGAVGPDTSALWVATEGRVWRLDLTDTSWSSLSTTMADQSLTLVGFYDVHVNAYADTSDVWASAEVRTSSADTSAVLLRYTQDEWTVKYGGERRDAVPLGISFVSEDLVYVVDSSHAVLLVDTTGGSPTRVDLNERLDNERVDRTTLQRHDILATDNGDGTHRLWIATSQGLFLSRHEDPSLQSQDNLLLIQRSLEVDGGVDHIRAYPSLLNESTPDRRVSFAYRLTRDASVTIQVFDWNMDLTRTVVRDAPRRTAGKGQLSNLVTEDYWDGTSQTGRVVAPGLYYYKITTSTGGRAFGKIVVALSR